MSAGLPEAHIEEWWTPETEIAQRETSTRTGWDPLNDLLGSAQSRLKVQREERGDFPGTKAATEKWICRGKESLRAAAKADLKAFVEDIQCRTIVPGDHFDREELVLRCSNGRKIPASLLLPRNSSAASPALIGLHDMGGLRAYGRERLYDGEHDPGYLHDHRQVAYQGQSPATYFAKAGFVVLMIDALYFGERTPTARELGENFATARRAWQTAELRDFNLRTVAEERIASTTELLTGKTYAAAVIEDDLAALDYLSKRPEVDPRRIGCFGLSYGSYRTHYLASLDERIQCAVSACWLSSLRGLVGYNIGGAIGNFALLPGLMPALDTSDLPALICPRPLLAISGWNDIMMQPIGIADAHRRLRAIYQKMGATDRLGSLIYDSPHEFNPTMQQQALAWFRQWLLPE